MLIFHRFFDPGSGVLVLAEEQKTLTADTERERVFSRVIAQSGPGPIKY